MNEGDAAGRESAMRMRTDSGDARASLGERHSLYRGSVPAKPALRNRLVGLHLLATGFVALFPVQAFAQGSRLAGMSSMFTPVDILYLALLAILIGASMLSAVFLVRQSSSLSAENDGLRASLAEARSEAETRSLLLSNGNERLLVYFGPGDPEVYGALPAESGAPTQEKRFLTFGRWIAPDVAEGLTHAICRLRGKAEAFRLEIDRENGEVIEVTGTTIGGFAAVRFVYLEGMRQRLHAIESSRDTALATLETLQHMFDSAALPVWLRDNDGRLTWVNAAYAQAVDAHSTTAALESQSEFLSEQDRATVTASLKKDGVFCDRLSTVVEADRRNFAVVETSGPFGSAGIASDVTETEQVRMALRQTIDSQSEMLDQLTTAVARFDDKTRLVYYNAALQRLFDLSHAFLETEPDHVSLLDHLRTNGTLPTERLSRSELQEADLAAYRATEPTEQLWHLSDRRTLRVIASPQPTGGATWIFEDISEKLELESQVRSTVQLQRETIDSLKEGVAVFASDGRLRLSNPSFADLFEFDPDFLASRPRIHAMRDLAQIAIESDTRSEGSDDATDRWTRFAQSITDFDETGRDTELGEMRLSSGRAIAYAVVPLPNAQTMLTFSDISDARQAEKMLLEKNEALEHANRIKNDFVQHVNYELRSPLTNIIGFSALLRSTDTGPLNPRQSEYLDYISVSTNSLLTIVNDILDLATIDAGIMELELSDVDIAETVDHAADGIRERMEEARVGLTIDLDKAAGTFRADAHRLTQILFNLLSNAANFAPTGSVVELRAERDESSVRFIVTDHGAGIAPERIQRMFERFEADPSGARQSGAGLGLSIVKSFVELHHGHIEIDSSPQTGTSVTCIFPLSPTDGAPTPGSSTTDRRTASPFRDAAE